MKTADEIYAENNFTKDMMLPNHLVTMLMSKHAANVAVAFAQWLNDRYEIPVDSVYDWCDSEGDCFSTEYLYEKFKLEKS